MKGFLIEEEQGQEKEQVVVVETFVDFHCPFSKKLFGTLRGVLGSSSSWGGQGRVRHRVQLHVQPWHSQATQMTLVALAAARAQPSPPSRLERLMHLFYDRQHLFGDQDVYDLSIRQLYDALIALAAEAGFDPDLIRAQLAPGPDRDAVVQDLKNSVRYARQNGIHASPTVLINGLVNPNISSSFSSQEWISLLDQEIAKLSARK